MQRRLLKLCAVVATAALPISPAAAQDGVFDMGQLTGTLSQDHVTQTEKKRAAQTGKQRTKREPPEVVCARLPEYRARFGASNPKIKELGRLCRLGGF